MLEEAEGKRADIRSEGVAVPCKSLTKIVEEELYNSVCKTTTYEVINKKGIRNININRVFFNSFIFLPLFVDSIIHFNSLIYIIKIV